MGTDGALHGNADLKAEIANLRASLDSVVAQAEAERRNAVAEHARLTFELGHRVKNTLSVVQALAGQTMRGSATKEEALETFGKRVLALARANDVILNQSWTTATIRSVAESVLKPFEATGHRLSIEGDEVRIPASAALSFGMALSELGSNAQRFGAWSSHGGQVALAWRNEPGDGDTLVLEWREAGGPPVSAPAKRGFGLKLVEQSLRSAFGRNVELRFDPAGVTCTVRCVLSELAA